MASSGWSDLVEQCERLLAAQPWATGEDLVRAAAVRDRAAALGDVDEQTIRAALAKGERSADFIVSDAWLRNRPTDPWVSMLVEVAGSDHFFGALAASLVLGALPTSPEVVEALVAAADAAPTATLHNTLVPLLRHAPEPAHIATAEQFARGPAPEAARNAVVRELWWIPHAEPTLAALRSGPDRAVAAEAAMGLALRGDTGALQATLDRLGSDDEEDRDQALIDVAGLPTRATAEALFPLLTHPTLDVASMASWALARVAATSSIPHFQAYADGDDTDLAELGEEALEWIALARDAQAPDAQPAWPGGALGLQAIARWLSGSDSLTRLTAHLQLVFLTGRLMPFDGYAAWPTQIERIADWFDIVAESFDVAP